MGPPRGHPAAPIVIVHQQAVKAAKRDLPDGAFPLVWFWQREVRLDVVAVAAAVLLLDHVPGLDQVCDDAEGAAFSDVQAGRDVAQAHPWVMGDAQQDPGVINQEGPARRDRRAPDQRRVTPPGQWLKQPLRGVLRSLTRLRRGPPATGTRPWRGFARRSVGAGNAAMACDLELPSPRRSGRRPGRPWVRFRR